ncbi:MAG: MBL fold metallo-hydrolase [Chloroflexota bacterium]|nr:MBL fold metallo-hydrolase [Chloroflexota bacterium]
MAGNRVTIGNVEITSLSDGILEFDLCNFFPNHKSDDEWQGYRQHLVDGHKVRFNLASYLIRSDGRTIIVDTGMGARPADAPDTPWGELMNDFQAHGIRTEDIDMVVMTHLHRDHVGWNLVPPAEEGGKYVPTFPNARYWFSNKDWEACHDPDIMPARFPNAPASVWPLEDLGLIEFMEGEHVLTSELTAFPSPGHTPGHMSIMVNSQGERAIILGDAIHNQAQVNETDWESRADMDPEQTRITRGKLMEQLETEDILGIIGHFPYPGFGKVVRAAGRRYWQPL